MTDSLIVLMTDIELSKMIFNLNLPGRNGGSLAVFGESRGFRSDALEDVVHEGVHDRHRLARDARVGVDLQLNE